MLPSFEYKTNTRIDNVAFSEQNILSIIRPLNQNKAHGWDNVSTRMIQICDDSIILPFAIIFKTALIQAFIQISGRKQMLFLCIKKIIKIC